MMHVVRVVSGHVFVPPMYESKRRERWWSCSCGRVGPGIYDDRRTDESILVGGKSHATRARKADR